MRLRIVLAFVLPIALVAGEVRADDPSPGKLIERHAREKSAVWTDGDQATFFYRGEAEQVTLVIGGDVKQLQRLPESDVWTLTLERPELEKGVFSFLLVPRTKDEAAAKRGQLPAFKGRMQIWRGPKAPPAPTVAEELKGVEKLIDFDSKQLGEKRKLKIYLPPGHDRSKTYPVVYAADGMTNAEVLEPLIVSGKVPSIVVVGVSSGSYVGDRDKPYETKNDLRALEYLPGFDDDRFARHERFFCEEVRAWAEKEIGASKERKLRSVYGVSNGGHFAVEMGIRHPELFGNVIGFSVAGNQVKLPSEFEDPPHFHLAAGTWEPAFHKTTSDLASKLKALKVPVDFAPRVAGHDHAMWRDEFDAALLRIFGKTSGGSDSRTGP